MKDTTSSGPLTANQGEPTLMSLNAILRDMLASGQTHDSEGNSVPLHSNIRADCAEALYRTVLFNRPSLVIEVGMAYGVSSLAILTALDQIGGNGALISIDPNQGTHWRGCGLVKVKQAGLQQRHTLIELPDYIALPRLLAEERHPNLAYIDGWHTFDHVFLDFWFLDQMLEVGGIVGFNDCGFPAVQKTIRFLQTHRKYKEIAVSLHAPNPPTRRRFFDWPPKTAVITNPQDRYFSKVEAWKPNWDFYAEF